MHEAPGRQREDSATPLVIAPGNYDGVHVGHQALIERARSCARDSGLRTRVLTFDPHPTTVLSPEHAATPLTTIDRRRELLLAFGADEVFVQPFSNEFAAQSPDAFVRSLLTQGTRAMVVGHDFRFGAKAAGDVEVLRALGETLGFEVFVEGPVNQAGKRVSSSAIRTALQAGDVRAAAAAQRRVHEVAGTVIRGDGRGAQLGFATANLQADPVLQPADGVYAVYARIEDEPGEPGAPLWRAVANLGVRPTFEAGRSLEVHVLDFEGDLYDKRLRVGFGARLRGERRFEGVDALKAQLQCDCDEARAALRALDESDEGWSAWI